MEIQIRARLNSLLKQFDRYVWGGGGGGGRILVCYLTKQPHW